jgi:hypothetical protein
MTKHAEPKAIRQLRQIRDEIHREAMAVGFDRYYEALDKKTGWLLGEKTKRATVVRERLSKYKTKSR